MTNISPYDKELINRLLKLTQGYGEGYVIYPNHFDKHKFSALHLEHLAELDYLSRVNHWFNPNEEDEEGECELEYDDEGPVWVTDNGPIPASWVYRSYLTTKKLEDYRGSRTT